LRYLILIFIVIFLSKNAFSTSFTCENIGSQSISVKLNAVSCDFNANKYFSPSFQKGAESLCKVKKMNKEKFRIEDNSLIYTLQLREIKYSKTKKDGNYIGVNLNDGARQSIITFNPKTKILMEATINFNLSGSSLGNLYRCEED